MADKASFFLLYYCTTFTETKRCWLPGLETGTGPLLVINEVLFNQIDILVMLIHKRPEVEPWLNSGSNNVC